MNKNTVPPVKKLQKRPRFCYNRRNGGVFMEDWRKDARHEPIIVDLDALVPKEHLLRKIERVMDYDWLYERLDPYYCHDNGRPGTDPVVLIKMVLIQHLFGIPSLRQTYREIQVNNAYRWFLGYSLLDNIPHFATVSYAFCRRFPDELISEIFEHILNKALNNRMLDPSAVFIDGTHIKASAKEKHAMRYTHHRGLAAVTRWVRLKFAAMNLKKLAEWSWKNSIFHLIFARFSPNCKRTHAFAC